MAQARREGTGSPSLEDEELHVRANVLDQDIPELPGNIRKIFAQRPEKLIYPVKGAKYFFTLHAVDRPDGEEVNAAGFIPVATLHESKDGENKVPLNKAAIMQLIRGTQKINRHFHLYHVNGLHNNEEREGRICLLAR